MDELTTKYTAEELKEIFEKMDWDKNGYITPVEFKSYLESLKRGEEISSEEVLQAFDQIDTDGSKQIHWEEFLEAMTNISQIKSSVSEKQMAEIFNRADLDRDGYLSYKEAKRAYKKLAKLTNRPTDQESVDRWVESADFDSDGRISMEEFKLSIAGNTLVDEV